MKKCLLVLCALLALGQSAAAQECQKAAYYQAQIIMEQIRLERSTVADLESALYTVQDQLTTLRTEQTSVAAQIKENEDYVSAADPSEDTSYYKAVIEELKATSDGNTLKELAINDRINRIFTSIQVAESRLSGYEQEMTAVKQKLERSK